MTDDRRGEILALVAAHEADVVNGEPPLWVAADVAANENIADPVEQDLLYVELRGRCAAFTNPDGAFGAAPPAE